MAKQIETGLTSYEFTEEELVSAATLNVLQRMYIQTRRAEVAGDKVALEYNPDKPLQFVKAAAFCDGWIAALDFLLDHEDAGVVAQRWKELIEAANGNSKP